MDNLDRTHALFVTDGKKGLEEQRCIHQRKAEAGYNILNSYADQAKTNANIEMYTFDFQQNLPAPTLTSGDMFYSRMLWTYNFGLHDMKTGDGIMHLWSESEAGRGSSEVCSCLRDTLLRRHEIHQGIDLVLFSDGCSGQNKNKAMMNFLFQLAKEGVYRSIQHFFLYRGHTFLPNDRDFSHIEKRKQVEKVSKPIDWKDVVKDSRLSQPFEVVFLDHTNFFDYKALADSSVKTTFKCLNGGDLKFKETMWFSYGASQEMDDTLSIAEWQVHPEEVWCRYTHSELEPWKKMNPEKRLTKKQVRPQLKKKYSRPIGIKPAKRNDLLSLAKKGLIASDVKEYYEGLPIKDGQRGDEDDDDFGDDYID